MLITNLKAEDNLSHSQRDKSLQEAIERITEKIKSKGDLQYVSAARQLELLDLLSSFDFGRFLVERGGLNGYWTQYAISSYGKSNHVLESFLLDKAPVVLATRERFYIFKKELQKRLFDGISIASVPCGLMCDLLELDYSNISNFSLTGIDLDPESIKYAKQLANEKLVHCQFFEKNAWDLNIKEQFDVITSNGLNIYELGDEKVISLYEEFFTALKPGGFLITSFLTTPSEWDRSKINPEDALLQKVIFADVLDCKWQALRSEEKTKAQLQKVGFTEIEINYDRAHLFPTVIAKK